MVTDNFLKMRRTHNFRELTIWKDSMTLTKEVYLLTASLPENEKFGLISQMRRSAVSIPSNIAEGSGRTSEKEFLHFLRVSLSSSYELETQLLLSADLFKIDSTQQLASITTLQKKTGAFIRTLTNSDLLPETRS
jgi:four helix bundle protein